MEMDKELGKKLAELMLDNESYRQLLTMYNDFMVKEFGEEKASIMLTLFSRFARIKAQTSLRDYALAEMEKHGMTVPTPTQNDAPTQALDGIATPVPVGLYL